MGIEEQFERVRAATPVEDLQIDPERLRHEARVAELQLGPTKELLTYFDKREKMASVDELTGLPNRGSFLYEARRKLATVQKNIKFAEDKRNDPKLVPRRAHERGNEAEVHDHYSIVTLDLDKFKNINDELGHPAGDEVLKRVAEIMLQNIRTDDAIGRIGGEEFMIAVSATSPGAGKVVADKIRTAIEGAVIKYGRTQIKVTASFGVATWRPKDTINNIMKRADVALYRAKNNGRNQVAEAEKL